MIFASGLFKIKYELPSMEKSLKGARRSLNTAVCGNLVPIQFDRLCLYTFWDYYKSEKRSGTLEGHHNVNVTISSFPSNPGLLKSGEPALPTHTASHLISEIIAMSVIPHSTIMKGKVHVIPNTPTVTYPVRTIGPGEFCRCWWKE